MTSTTPVAAGGTDAYDAIADLGAAPLWRHLGGIFSPEPVSRAVPHVWHYRDLRPWLLHFADVLSVEEAERRVLMLLNPGMQTPPATVNSLYAGIQVILPGETAPAHRHTANALRFVIEGSGACTTVDGERVPMAPGDLLLTPGWTWHDHVHEGDGPMMWLDGLDYPLTNAFEAGFFEPHPDGVQPPSTRPENLGTRQFIHGRLNPVWQRPGGASSPIGNYPWLETERALDAIADDALGSTSDGIMLEYTNPWTGGPVMPTIGCRVQRLRPGFRGTARRHTASTILHVVRGSGRSIVDGRELSWNAGDVLAVPGWAEYRHLNDSPGEDAVLFGYSNEPAVRALGMYRERPGTDAG